LIRAACIGECMLELSGLEAGGASRLGFGGDTLNTAVYLARELGAAGRVDYVTALGDDPFSEDMASAWVAEGIGTSLVFRLTGALPGLYVIRTGANGERSFYYWRSEAAARRLLEDGRDEALRRSLAGHALVYLSGITLAILDQRARASLVEVLEAVAAGGGAVALDANYRPRLWPGVAAARTAMETVAARCRYVLPSAEDDVALFGDGRPEIAAARWRDLGALEVVVKSGPDGCLIVGEGGSSWHVPARRVEMVVDTTAAGDSFNGAYLAARVRGATPVDAARRGHALAAEVIRYPGAIAPRT
jgi:2-dehydro-3-deoxygluconokinase